MGIRQNLKPKLPQTNHARLSIIFAFTLCLFIVCFHLIYSFEDIGAKLESILKEAKKTGLKPLPESNKILAMQKAIFAKTPVNMSREQIELGKILYFDPRLSGGQDVSCNSCHNLSLQGTSRIMAGKNKLNPPTIFNLLFNDSLYYEGRFTRFKEGAKNSHNKDSNSIIPKQNIIAKAVLHALKAEDEMKGDMDKIISMITKSSEYMSYFRRAYGSKVKVTPELVALSLSSFVVTLNTFSRYDDFMAGNLRALSVDEAQGIKTFIDKGCVSCHNDVNLGGTMQPFEVIKSYKLSNIGGLKSNEDKMLKVPTLRSITLTAPYFHNGGFAKLEDAIKEMGLIQLGISLNRKDIESIMGFFETLRGDVEVSVPSLPKI